MTGETHPVAVPFAVWLDVLSLVEHDVCRYNMYACGDVHCAYVRSMCKKPKSNHSAPSIVRHSASRTRPLVPPHPPCGNSSVGLGTEEVGADAEGKKQKQAQEQGRQETVHNCP